MNEARMLRALKKGDRDAIAWFVDSYGAYVATIVNNIIGAASTEDVEEICSDVFVALWQNAHRIKGECAKSYLARIARNKAIDHIRSAGLMERSLDEDSIMLSLPGPETEVEKAEEERLVRSAVLAMGHPDREIFLRHYFFFQSVASIATAMEMPENTVKTRLRRGREKLRACLEKEIKV